MLFWTDREWSSVYTEMHTRKGVELPIRVLIAAVAFFSITVVFSFAGIYIGVPWISPVYPDQIQLTAHRGASVELPENTMPAIEAAIEEQADFVEVDIRVTKDGELALLHDSSLRRTTGLDKYIWDVDYSEIAQLDAGSWLNKELSWARIPTLREVIEVCKGKVSLNLHLKHHHSDELLEEKVVALIEEFDMLSQCVITSTQIDSLAKVKALNPEIQTGFIADYLFSELFDNNSVDFFSVKSNLVTADTIKQIHQCGKKIHVWTVNSNKEMKRLGRVGVDNIITDVLANAKKVLNRTAKHPSL